jgi:hypothetical protein
MPNNNSGSRIVDSIDNLFRFNNFNKSEFKQLVFDNDDEAEVDMNEKDYDKENQPPVPRESSKYSYNENNVSPLEINLEAGISHIVSDSSKLVEIPITVEFKLTENICTTYGKDYIIVFNTRGNCILTFSSKL